MLATGAVWLMAVASLFFMTKVEVERVLDARLKETGQLVNSLIIDQLPVVTSSQFEIILDSAIPHSGSEERFLCQIWSQRGVLLNRSESTPIHKLADIADGFSETLVDGESWRIFAVTNSETGMQILVGDSLKVRGTIVNGLLRGLLIPLLLIFPALSFVIWLAVGQGLSPLNRVARDLKNRPASNLKQIETTSAASEIAPVLQSLNDLFSRVSELRERERNFIAYAAHELRTPLSGLKTQAQVALASDDVSIRKHALNQIVVAVDRTGRLVQQLLDMSQADASERSLRKNLVNIGTTLNAIAFDLSDENTSVEICISKELEEFELEIDPVSFMLAARNLLENAVNHSPAGGTVRCKPGLAEEGAFLIIEDDGPGIPGDELSMVTERFFRGRSTTTTGSGLGLSIVVAALSRIDWQLKLENRPGGGLSAIVGRSMSFKEQE